MERNCEDNFALLEGGVGSADAPLWLPCATLCCKAFRSDMVLPPRVLKLRLRIRLGANLKGFLMRVGLFAPMAALFF